MNPKIIAVDFDGTICKLAWPNIGDANPEVINYLKAEKEKGAKLILWTCRVDDMLATAVEWCKEQGLVFDAVNENLPEIVKEFGSDTRKIFANEYIDDLSNHRFKLPFTGEMSWAEQEVALACANEKAISKDTDEWEYGVTCFESALRAYNTLVQYGHSGHSIQYTKGILNRLIDGKCLTPIEDTPDIWHPVEFSKNDPREHYQCKRMPSLFKEVDTDGTVTYSDVERATTVNVDKPENFFQNGFVTRLIDKMFPITMPYFPASKKFKVVRDEFQFDPENDDYDTTAFLYLITPDGTRVELNRYFKDGENGMIPIDKSEFDVRKAGKVETL